MGLQLKAILKSRLKERGIALSSLARKTGVSRKTIDNWLEGQKPQNIEQVKSVADFLELTVDELCFGPKTKAVGETDDIEKHLQEINAGIFEVVLRRVKK